MNLLVFYYPTYNNKNTYFRASEIRFSAEMYCNFWSKMRLSAETSYKVWKTNIKMSSKGQKQRKSQSRDNKGKTARSREAIKSSKTNLRLDLEPPKGSQVSPKRPPRAPKRSPRQLQNGLTNIFKDKKQIFQKSTNVWPEIHFFEVPKVIFGAQNRPEEPPKEYKNQLRRKQNTSIQKGGPNDSHLLEAFYAKGHGPFRSYHWASLLQCY